MERNDIIQNIQNVLREVLEDDKIVINENMSAKDIPGWDSLAHINIIELIEKKFEIKFLIGEIVVLKNISDLANLITEKLNEKNK